MSFADPQRISFLELAERVLEQEGKPLTVGEIWELAKQKSIASLLKSSGKTPEASLGARLYTEVKKPSSRFVSVGSAPARFVLKSHLTSVPQSPQQLATTPPPEI